MTDFPGRHVHPSPATRGELHQQRALYKRQAEVLPLVRAQAERWTAATAGIAGGAGLAALIAGPGQFSKLADPWSTLVGLLFFAGAAAGVVANFAAASAAQVGFERGVLSVAAADRHRARETDRAMARLLLARWATTSAICLVLVSAAFLWVAPTGASVVLRGTTATGEVVCGPLDRVGDEAVVIDHAGLAHRIDRLRPVRAARAC